jgi:hypothetical protein
MTTNTTETFGHRPMGHTATGQTDSHFHGGDRPRVPTE